MSTDTVLLPPAAPAADGPSRPGTGLWWAAPWSVVLLVVPLSLGLAWATSDVAFRRAWGTPKVLTTEGVVLFAAGAALLVAGSLLAAWAWRGRDAGAAPGLWALGPDDPRLALLRRSAWWLFGATLVGYAGFAVSGLRNAGLGDLPRLLTSSPYTGELKRTFSSVPGVTTATQFGIAFAVVATVVLVRRPEPRLRAALVAVLLLAALRGYAFSERLALIEVLVPVLLVVATAVARGGSRARATAVRLLPVAALPVLLVVFGVFEYFRSWQFYSTRETGTFADFVVRRLSGYYVTAYNNGAIGLEHDDAPGRLPYGSAQALWTSPGVEQLGLYQRLSGQVPDERYGQALELFGNPEFNNPGGLAVPFVDHGVVGGLVFMLCTGIVLGSVYALLQLGAPVGVLVYPAVYSGLLELPRYWYWSQGRLLPSLVALVVVAVLLSRPGAPPEAPVPVPTPARGTPAP